jgi:hypothetical protein
VNNRGNFLFVSTLRAVSILIFLGLIGLAVATLLVSRDPIPAEVSGSPALPEYPALSASNVLGWGSYLTRAPDGEAYVLVRYSTPEAFTRLIQSYPGDVSSPYRIITAALQTSDDGTNWTNVAEASAQNGKIVFDLSQAGAHKIWKMTVVKSGADPEVGVGLLSFVNDNIILRKVPVDVVWLGLLPASLLVLMSFQKTLSLGRLFLATAVPVALFVLFYTLGYVDIHTMLGSDSELYLDRVVEGSYSTSRSTGYPTFLLAVQNSAGLDYLPWIQLGIGTACYLAGAYLLAVRFSNKWFGSVLALAFLLQGATSHFAPVVMTEELFMAGIGLFAAALGALAWRPDWPAVIAASIGIVLATLTKSHGVVLCVPALLLIRFLPKGRRLSVSGAIVVSGLATYGLMAVNSYIRTGVPAPESFAGFSLIAHVGWMLDDASMPPTDLTRSLISAAAPVIEQRPADLANIHSLATLDRYVDVTAQDFNPLFWGKLYPIAISQLGTRVRVNSFFLRFALSSIRAHPLSYLRHVVAHFYGLWRDLGQMAPLGVTTVNIRRQPLSWDLPENSAFRSKVPVSPYPSEETIKGESLNQSNLPLIFKKIWDADLFSSKWTIALGMLAFLLCILFLIPGRLAYIYRTEIMIALSLNAYFGVHVLLQVSYWRYAWVGILPAIFLTAAFVFTSACAGKSFVTAWAFPGSRSKAHQLTGISADG